MSTKRMNLDIVDNTLENLLNDLYTLEEVGVIYSTKDSKTIKAVLKVIEESGVACNQNDLREACKTIIADKYVKDISDATEVDDKVIIQDVVGRKYEKYYEENKLFSKIKTLAFKGSEKLLYTSFVLYEVLMADGTPPHIKTSIISGLGYFICPIDLIPDMIIGVGLSDDLGALMVSIKMCEMYITDEIKAKASSRVSKIIKPDMVANI